MINNIKTYNSQNESPNNLKCWQSSKNKRKSLKEKSAKT